MNNFILTDTSLIEDQDNSRAFYPFYVGIDIGSDFHVAACIPFEKFRSTLITIGAKTTATKASVTLAEMLPNNTILHFLK
ncbi:hypothetical protein [Paenibacillus periandrae]|uniref:hypothetical protein n=1 Tax=Paenibacillus periandrae TaxID=1761741 RepID=UPI001F08A8BE|nr:hypothetical protein [Paenibacillus periandrae]